MVYSNPKLSVVKGEFGNRDTDKMVQIAPMRNATPQRGLIGSPPKRVMRLPESIFIDPDFQRNITDRGKKLIHEMVEKWNWDAAEVPRIYFDEERGVEAAYDGQHTLIGAATRDDITEIPCDLHEDIRSAKRAAAAFNVRNSKRIPQTPAQLFKSALLAEFPWAVQLNEIANRLNFTIAAYHGAGIYDRPDNVIAIITMKNVMDRRGGVALEKIMKMLSGLTISPIKDIHIRAIETLLFDKEFSKLVTLPKLRQTLRGLNNNIMVADATAEGLKRGMPRHLALANAYLREYQGVHGVS